MSPLKYCLIEKSGCICNEIDLHFVIFCLVFFMICLHFSLSVTVASLAAEVFVLLAGHWEVMGVPIYCN